MLSNVDIHELRILLNSEVKIKIKYLKIFIIY